MALQPHEAEMLQNINREVGETKVIVEGLADTVAAHALSIGKLQQSSASGSVKHRVAIALGLSGVGAGSLGAAEPGWLASILRSLGG